MFNITQFLLHSIYILFPSTWLAILSFVLLFNILSLPFIFFAFKQKNRIKSKILFFMINKSALNLLIQKVWFSNFIFINYLNYLRINSIYFNLKFRPEFLIWLIFNFQQMLTLIQLKSSKKYFRQKWYFHNF